MTSTRVDDWRTFGLTLFSFSRVWHVEICLDVSMILGPLEASYGRKVCPPPKVSKKYWREPFFHDGALDGVLSGQLMGYMKLIPGPAHSTVSKKKLQAREPRLG